MVYKQMDMTEDGKVSMLEFSELAYPGSDHDLTRAAFSAMDFDNSGA